MLKRIQKRKQKRNQLLMGLVLVFLMIFGMMGVFTYNNTGEAYEYKDYKFTWDGKMFSTKIDGEPKQFYTIPQELQNINRTESFASNIRAPGMYLTFDPDQATENLVYLDVLRNDIVNEFDSVVVSAITSESEVYELPVITCENSSAGAPVIYLMVSNKTIITSTGPEDSCTIVQSSLQDLLKIRDLMIYTYHGVIDE